MILASSIPADRLAAKIRRIAASSDRRRLALGLPQRRSIAHRCGTCGHFATERRGDEFGCCTDCRQALAVFTCCTITPACGDWTRRPATSQVKTNRPIVNFSN